MTLPTCSDMQAAQSRCCGRTNLPHAEALARSISVPVIAVAAADGNGSVTAEAVKRVPMDTLDAHAQCGLFGPAPTASMQRAYTHSQSPLPAAQQHDTLFSHSYEVGAATVPWCTEGHAKSCCRWQLPHQAVLADVVWSPAEEHATSRSSS